MGSLKSFTPDLGFEANATQLDICDQTQTFGIVAIQTAMEPTPVASQLLSSILALANTSLKSFNSGDARQNADCQPIGAAKDSCYAFTPHVVAKDGTTSTPALLSFCLDMMRLFISDVRGAWLGMNCNEILNSILITNVRFLNLSSATYLLCLRLGIVFQRSGVQGS